MNERESDALSQLPSIIMGNVQSLRNKPDAPETCVRYLHKFREASLLCLTETWFSDLDPDPQLPGFTLMRCDRSRGATGKTGGGGGGGGGGGLRLCE